MKALHRDEAPFRRATCREGKSLVDEVLCTRRMPFVEWIHVGSPLHKERTLVEETSCKEVTAHSRGLLHRDEAPCRRIPMQRDSIHRGETLEEEGLCAKRENPCRGGPL